MPNLRAPLLFLGLLTLGMSAFATGSITFENSRLGKEMHRVRFGAVQSSSTPMVLASTEEDSDFAGEFAPGSGEKSPFKAFLLSATVPGAGQYYNGSRIKPFLFLGAEISAWVMHVKWQGDGDDATDAYEAFNREHWSRHDYEERYLLLAYGVNDDRLIHATEVSHHLPDTETQQYFEMTGKYDQFAWGWDDAVREGLTLDDYVNASDPGVKITGESTTPGTANRLTYETMRHDANNKYDKAGNMVMVSIVNRVVASFEAFFAAKRHNRNPSRAESTLENISVRASLKSYNEDKDTPFVKLSYKF